MLIPHLLIASIGLAWCHCSEVSREPDAEVLGEGDPAAVLDSDNVQLERDRRQTQFRRPLPRGVPEIDEEDEGIPLEVLHKGRWMGVYADENVKRFPARYSAAHGLVPRDEIKGKLYHHQYTYSPLYSYYEYGSEYEDYPTVIDPYLYNDYDYPLMYGLDYPYDGFHSNYYPHIGRKRYYKPRHFYPYVYGYRHRFVPRHRRAHRQHRYRRYHYY